MMHVSCRSLSLAILPWIALALVAPLPAAVHAEDTVAPRPDQAVVDAIDALFGAHTLAFEASTRRVKHDAGGGGMSTVIMGAGGNRKPFQGDFATWSTGERVTLASTAVLPGFGILATDDREVKEVTYEDAPMDLGTFRRDVLALTDGHRMRKWLKKATWTRAEGDGDGVRTTWTADISRRLIPSPPAANPVMAPQRNLAVRATLVLRGTKIHSLAFEVDRNDPEAAMRRRVMREHGGSIRLPGGARLDDEDEDGPAVAETWHYAFTPRETPTARVAAMARTLAAKLSPPTKSGPAKDGR